MLRQFESWPRQGRTLIAGGSPTDVGIIAFLVIMTAGWSVVAGKDLNWDQLNYHFYAAYNLLGGRLDRDFMAGNVQSYFNPLAYVPFYWMVKHDWPSMLVGVVLAIVHSGNIVLCYLISTTAVSSHNPTHVRIVGLGGAVLGFLSPVFVFEVGTSFADISTSVLVLLGIFLALRSEPPRRWWHDRTFLAGLSIGAAIGLKLSNVIYGPACAVLVCCLPISWKRRASCVGYLALGGLTGTILTHGYWSWALWQEFGNPFFPMFNAYFASADYPAINHLHGRFLAEGLWDAASLPLRMTLLRSWIYTESVAPDLRFAALLFIGITGVAIFIGRRFRRSLTATSNDFQKILPLLAFFASAYALWLITSGNGRYGISVLILCGPVLALVVAAVLGKSRSSSYLFGILGTIVILQLVHLHAGQLRWDTGPWTRTWYEASVPQRLKTEPYLYISIGSSSNSYIAPFLAPDSAFTNPIGQLSFDLDGPGGARLRQLFAQYKGRTRILILASIPNEPSGFVLSKAWEESANSMLSRLGFVVNPTDCLMITSSGLQREAGSDFAAPDSHVRQLATCTLSERALDKDELERRAEARRIFEEIVHWCPGLFKPDYTVVEHTPRGWFSSYADSDSMLRLEGDRVFLTQPHTSAEIALGKPADWTASGPRPGCSNIPHRLWRVYNFG